LCNTLHEAVAVARARLRAAGIDPAEADLDARVLARHVLGWDAARLLADGQIPPPAGFAPAYDALVGRRARREPIAYITGQQEFFGLTFDVSPAVLIPRPETERVVEAALERFPDRDATLAAADLCTGSGCVAIALAVARRGWIVTATDVSADALAIASLNARRHGVAGRVRLVEGDLLGGLHGSFDLIVSNPPYVADGLRPTLPPEVRDHEPAVALFAGADGLDVVRRLVADAGGRLHPGGALIVEIGFGQADAVADLLSSAPLLRFVAIEPDLQGIPRTAVALRA
jgi:release factor glutamine methyltransferase